MQTTTTQRVRTWRPLLLSALGLLPLLAGAQGISRSAAVQAERVTLPTALPAPVQRSVAKTVASTSAGTTGRRGIQAAISSTATGGDWSATTTWVGGVVPTAADAVTIVGGATVTLDVASACASLTVNATGSLVNSATASNKLEVGGNVTNNGTLDLSFSSTIGSDLRFVGAGDATFTGTGTTDLQTVSLAKSVRADVVEMNLPTLSVKGSTTTTDGFLSTRITTNTVDDMTGTFKISGTGTFNNRVFSNAAAYVIPATGGFWLNNPNFTVASQTGTPVVNGLLRITAGTYNVGSSSGNSLTFGASAVFTVEGGSLSSAGRVTNFTGASAVSGTMTFTMSGGTINVSTVGNTSGTPSFGVNGATTISGGTINLVQRSTATTPLDYYVAGTYTYTGGTVNIGTAATATNFDFRVRGSFPNLNIDNTTNAKSAVMQGQTNVFGTTLINPTTTLNLNGFLLLQIGAAVTNNGILNGTTTSSTLYFQGSTAQTYGGTGTATAPLRTLTIDNSSTGVTLNSPLTVTRVNMFTGNLNGTSNLTIGDGSLSLFVVQIGVASNTTTSGSFASAPTFNIGTGAYLIIYAQETTGRTTGVEVPATRVIDGLTIANTNGVTLAGGNLTINTSGVYAAGTLTLTSGLLTTSAANTAILGVAAAPPTGSATSYVRGPLGITVNSATAVSRTFAVGDAAAWRPVVVGGITASTDQTFTATVINGPTGAPGTQVTPNPTRYVRLQNTTNLPATATVQLSYGADDTSVDPATAVVAQAPAATGTYVSRGGTAVAATTTAPILPTGIVSTQNIVPGNDYFVLGTPVACNAAFTYPAASYCTSGTNPTPTITGNTGGAFSSTTGLTLNATTGVITLTSSTPGTYTVTYTAPGACTATASVTVTAPATAGFSYGATSFCTSATATAMPTLATGATAGTFSSTTGLTLDPANGAFLPSSSTPGTYTITNTVAASGGCAAVTSTATVTITAPATAGFSYATASACAGSAATLSPTLATGATAGTFSSTTGLTLSAAGVINPATSTAGTYTVTNTVAAAGGCAAVTSTATVTINALPATPTATVTYPTVSTAQFSSSAAPTGTTYQWYLNGVAITGATSQTYTANGATSPGAYTVRFLATATGCQSAASAATTITATSKPLAGSSLDLFPNPTRDGQLTLQLTGYNKAVTLTVVNAIGQVVSEQRIPAGQSAATLSLTTQPAGVYLLRVTTEGGTDVRRIVRE